MSRFFVPANAIRGNSIVVDGKEAHHILDVMRLKELDKVVAFDGTGKEYVGFIRQVKRKSLVVEIVETRAPAGKDSSLITLAQAIPKKEKMDYIVEKSTELGAHSIIPLVTKRTIVKWDEKKRISNVERWRRIAKEASKQCARRDISLVQEVKAFNDFIKTASDYDIGLIAALSDEAISLRDALKGFRGGKVAAAIGPEGDFTTDEITKALEAGFKLVNLGPRVLKSDTAGLAILAILNYELAN